MPITLETLFSAAPYVAELAGHHEKWFTATRGMQPDEVCRQLIAEVEDAADKAATEAELRASLRGTKGRFALIAAVAEVSGAWATETATAALSDFADATIDAALDFLVREAAAANLIAVDREARPARQSGLAILALGKLGGRELNYSSDIDLAAFYDAARARLSKPGEAPRFYEKLVRRMTALIAERDSNGYVFRTDLRLRPDPGSTPVAISAEAALTYYEARGQNWERAAWIKARAAAGDIEGGEAFLGQMAPFIWRKHLDFATIADIQAMKRQINAARKVGGERAFGHNVKLGRGGIREIEFFAQTQQLIAGGREPALRCRSTVRALEQLARHRFIETAAAEILTSAYWFLRAVENRLQMRRDEQTHEMPDTEAGIAPVAALMGFAQVEEFAARYRGTVEMVIDNYAELFADEASLASDAGDLVFTGDHDDPATLETLRRLGFRAPEAASKTIRKWHYGGYAATRADLARQHLAALVPGLLDTLAATGNA
ncbi:MAG: bifunctional [glutamine synthetase] adenylyltransferase/[glutamine synthetase]-adenylyl-L-tyrosine phosphorylase, partial [Cucumibacter sp.]